MLLNKKWPTLLILLLQSSLGFGQQSLFVRVTGIKNEGLVANASIKGVRSFTVDSSGSLIHFPATGKYSVAISAVGYKESLIKVVIPYPTDTLQVELESDDEELEEVIVRSTRTSRTIANVPTRVETVEMEEIDEKNNMRPANVAMLLHESTGIQVQQTSATSGNASIRIQGLDGRYTQLLKDGFPNFGNFSSGLSVLEIPPLDLQQVEIIKGPASPLFGGGAIAGVINFISRTPKTKPEYNFLINQSNIGQTNIGGFASGGGSKFGYTMLALYNRQLPYDVDNDNFTEVPKSHEVTIQPRLFFYPSETSVLTVGISHTFGRRTGGDVKVIKGEADINHQYFERNETLRNITTIEYERQIAKGRHLVAKQSFSVFDRSIATPTVNFKGVEHYAYSDISYVTSVRNHALVLGVNFIYNRFNETSVGNRDNSARTGGAYAQYTWDASENIKLESGLRIDVVDYRNRSYSNTEAFVLPRVSLLIQYNAQWSSRIGGGMGYKAPTLFTEQTESIQYRRVKQLENVISEESYGGTADVNFRTYISDHLAFSLNHMFFYTLIDNPLVLSSDSSGLFFRNLDQPVESLGFETNARFIFRDNFKVFLGYTFTHAVARYLTRNQFLPLVPKSKLNAALIYEKEDFVKVGLEAYFTGRQFLSNGDRTPSFWELGFMAEKIFEKFSLYINFENFTDTRQSRFKRVVNGSNLNPTFDEIWTHTEGFVFNGGVKLRL